jgi:hypothetical protein
LHRALRRIEAEDAAVRRQQRGLAANDVPRRAGARIEQLIVGAALLIAGVLWAGLAAPVWLGWIGAAVGLAVLALCSRRR